MATLTDKAKALAATAAEIAELQGATLEARVLREAFASLIQSGYDNWDGGTDFYTFALEVPIPTYAALENERDQLEEAIHNRISQLVRADSGKRIREQQFVMEDLADPVTVELVTSTQHQVSLKKVMEWMAHAGGVSPKEIAMKARVREGKFGARRGSVDGPDAQDPRGPPGHK